MSNSLSSYPTPGCERRLMQSLLLQRAWKATPAAFAERLSARRTPKFKAARKKQWTRQRHLTLISDKLAEAAFEKNKRIIINIPPRHGKSELCSRYFPAWFLEHFPGDEIILASYGGNYAKTWGRKVRNLIKDNQDILANVHLDADSQNAAEWLTTMEGGMVSRGVGGDMTGRGCRLLLIDDPVKNWKEAYSETQRNGVWEWYQSTASTRLEPDGSIVLIMTRWHDDDMAGRCVRDMEHGGDKWEVINLPALAEENDPLGREIGEALWPDRFSREKLLSIKRRVGPLVWEGLYQQNPHPPGGGYFKADNWVYWRSLPDLREFRRISMSWDMTFKDTRTGSYVVGQVWGFTDSQAWLLDQVRGRMDFVGAQRAVQLLSAKWPQAHAKYIEEKANGAAIIASLATKVRGLIPVNPEGSKEARAAAISPFQRAHNLVIPHPLLYPWVRGFIAEHEAFPNAKDDDQVDGTSQAISQEWLTGWQRIDSDEVGGEDRGRPYDIGGYGPSGVVSDDFDDDDGVEDYSVGFGAI